MIPNLHVHILFVDLQQTMLHRVLLHHLLEVEVTAYVGRGDGKVEPNEQQESGEDRMNLTAEFGCSVKSAN